MDHMQNSSGALEHHLSAGQAALESGRYRDAAEHFGAAYVQVPESFALAQMAANSWRLVGDVLAERALWQAVFSSPRPTDVSTLYLLGTGLLETGAPWEACACFEAVVGARPDDPAAVGALAAAQRANGNPVEAWTLIQRALTLTQEMPSLLLSAAQIRYALGDTEGSLAWLAEAEAVRPRHPLQQIQLAFSHLIDGACLAGWEAFEARGLPVLPQGARDWHGELLHGQSIAIVNEQGLGDLFHFVRYVRRLEQRGASRVVVEAPPSTVRLLRASGLDVVPTGALPTTDWAVPILSLPHRLQSDGDTASECVPYLHTGMPKPMASTRDKPRIGIVSRGNPAFLATTLRDLDDAALAQILAVTDVQWVWLQFDLTPPPSANAVAIERPSLSGDWLDTAVLLEQLDVVVTVDTAVAHLAGALGMQAIVLLPFTPDWRWGREREDCAWYPSVRLIRQSAPKEWTSALETLPQILGEMLRQRFP